MQTSLKGSEIKKKFLQKRKDEFCILYDEVLESGRPGSRRPEDLEENRESDIFKKCAVEDKVMDGFRIQVAESAVGIVTKPNFMKMALDVAMAREEKSDHWVRTLGKLKIS